MEYTLISTALKQQLGAKVYANNVVYIAEILAELDPATMPELRQPGAEEWVVRCVVTQIMSKKQRVFGNADVMKLTSTTSLDGMSADSKSMMDKRTTEEGITEYVGSINKTNQSHCSRDKLQRITDIRQQLLDDPNLHLTKIKHDETKTITANDWLSDLVGPHCLDRDSQFIRNIVDEIRRISKANANRNKKMPKLRDIISKQDLDTLNPKAIWDKYGFEARLNESYDARFRVRLQRLKQEYSI